jgi:molecular chaperone DnaJ
VAKNYYLILGVSPDATPNQIKAAYRDRAKEFHPDLYGGGQRPFLDVQEAYCVLSDAGQRHTYDRALRDLRGRATRGAYRPEPLKPQSDPVDLGEASLVRSFRSFTPSFDEIFDRLWGNFMSLTRPKAEQIESLNIEIVLTPEQAARGGHIRVLVPARALCPTCEGYGGVAGYECAYCAGEGFLSGEYPVLVSFPAGIVNGYIVRLPLDGFGIRNFYLTVHFSATGDTEFS